jgi:transposase-like protein
MSKDEGLEVSKIAELSFAEDPKCPGCDSPALMRWGKERGLQRYRRRSCPRTFNLLTGTALERLRHKDKWLVIADHLKVGSTLQEAVQALGVNRNTAFQWRHRFLDMPKDERAASLAGIVEADEMYFRESQKGSKGPILKKARCVVAKPRRGAFQKNRYQFSFVVIEMVIRQTLF